MFFVWVTIGQFISSTYEEKGAQIEFFNHTGGIISPADFSISLPARYKWEPGDTMRISAQRPTGTTLEIWLDGELVASGPYPELTYTFTKRQIAYLTVVYRSQEADAMTSYGLVVTCPA